eukprot:335832-Hanusia_phi.AAC.1
MFQVMMQVRKPRRTKGEEGEEERKRGREEMKDRGSGEGVILSRTHNCLSLHVRLQVINKTTLP